MSRLYSQDNYLISLVFIYTPTSNKETPMTIPFTVPSLNESAFNCPYCNAFAKQTWHDFTAPIKHGYAIIARASRCEHCQRYSIWQGEKMIYPDFSGITPPNQDLSVEIQRDYKEAASITQKSPRGAAALLRLSIQKLCKQLGQPGENINSDIGELVKQGLPVKIQQALDVVRVVGNEAVHPGELNLKDNQIRDIIKYLEVGKPLPEQYRFLLFEDKREVELVWNGKTNEVCNVVLPFQTIEHVDEPRTETGPHKKELQFGLFDERGRQLQGWTNKLIWGDNKLILSSLKN